MLLRLGPFGGELPRLAPEHLPAGPATGALRALDCKIYSGDLIPVSGNQAGPAAGVDLPETFLGLYPEVGSDVSAIRWLAWEGAGIDAVVAPSEGADAEARRVYWTTGDDATGPRWTTYQDAGATGGEPDADFPLLFPSLPKPQAAVQAGQPTENAAARTYVYTLVNSLGWESAPSFPSDSIEAADGARVDVTIPAIAGAAGNRWESVRIYRTSVGTETVTYRQVGPTRDLVAMALLDDVPQSGLGAALATADYSPLPGDAEGLTLAHNGIYAAFSRDVLHLSVPDTPWAWPIANRYDIAAPIVAIAATNNAIVVLTEEYPYLLTGSDPARMTLSRIDTPHPCLSKRSVVALGNAVVYASHAGLVTIQDVTAAVPTAAVHDWDTWRITRPDTLRAAWYKGRYLAVGQEEAFVFSPPGELISVTLAATALWADIRQGRTFVAMPKGAADASAPLAWYDADDQLPRVYQWVSRVFVLDHPMLFGTLAVIADFDAGEVIESEEWEAARVANAALLAAYEPIGTMGGPARTDPAGPSTPPGENAAMGRTIMAGAPWEERFGFLGADGAGTGTGRVRVLLYDGAPPDTWAPRAAAPVEGLLAELWLNDRKPVRFAPPYRVDELSVVVESSTRLKRVYVCETPRELRQA